jgi:hypothetical protein
VVRALVVLGGAAVLLLLGEATAGAAEAIGPELPGHTLTVAVPLPPAPAAPSMPGVSVHLPGVAVELGPRGVTASAGPVSLPSPVVDLPVPSVPVPAPTGIEPIADPAPASTVRDEPMTTNAGRATAADGRAPAATVPRGPTTLRAPAPVAPTGPPTVALVLQLLGLGAGVDLASRRSGASDAGVLGVIRVLRNRLRLGAVRVVVRGGTPPGFGLLLARPG